MDDALWIITKPQVTPHNMLQQAYGLRLHQLVNHVTQHSHNREKSFVSVTNVCQTGLIEKNLLNDEDCDGFGEFRPGFHDAETEWNNFCGEQKVDDGVVVILLEKQFVQLHRSKSYGKEGYAP